MKTSLHFNIISHKCGMFYTERKNLTQCSLLNICFSSYNFIPCWNYVRRNIPVTNRKALGLSLNVDKTCAEYFNGLMEKLKRKVK